MIVAISIFIIAILLLACYVNHGQLFCLRPHNKDKFVEWKDQVLFSEDFIPRSARPPTMPLKEYDTNSGATWASPEDYSQAGGQTGQGDPEGAHYGVRQNNVPHVIVPGANAMHFGRPGTVYRGFVYPTGAEPPALVVRLLLDNYSQFHSLVAVFHAVRDLAAADCSQRNIVFEVSPVDHSVIGSRGPLPRIVKFRRNGEVLTYAGATNAGALYDWVMNESYLSNYQSP